MLYFILFCSVPGTLDCAALTPIIRKEYPELLATEPHLDCEESFHSDGKSSMKEALTSEPGLKNNFFFFFFCNLCARSRHEALTKKSFQDEEKSSIPPNIVEEVSKTRILLLSLFSVPKAGADNYVVMKAVL